MNELVLDASVAVGWVLADESDQLAADTLTLLQTVPAVVPQHWHLEIRNALLTAERRGRLPSGMVEDHVETLGLLPILTDQDPDFRKTLALARTHTLTFYDALYLELAIRQGAAMASHDAALVRACHREGITVPTSPSSQSPHSPLC